LRPRARRPQLNRDPLGRPVWMAEMEQSQHVVGALRRRFPGLGDERHRNVGRSFWFPCGDPAVTGVFIGAVSPGT
jgi:hypothetical protein